jgi:hypothetical protein
MNPKAQQENIFFVLHYKTILSKDFLIAQFPFHVGQWMKSPMSCNFPQPFLFTFLLAVPPS